MAFDISNMTEEEKKEALKALQDDANAKKEDTAKRADIRSWRRQVQEAVNKAMRTQWKVLQRTSLTMMTEDHGTNPEESRGSRTEVLRRSC